MKKIRLNNVSGKLSDSQLKDIIGGYLGTGPNSPCYSSSGSCHSSCIFIYNSVAYTGTCKSSGSYCACVVG